ncbi:MAG: AraC family transcriptional regulator [Treponema sp.]|nr:AraC family transcriptional regulator [Treponema sp.]
MAIDYYSLPLFKSTYNLNDKNKSLNSKRLLLIFDENAVNQIQKFHTGNFQLSGSSHFMPDFMISEDAKKFLNYPQGFLIMNAKEEYFTDRSDLNSYELRFTLEGEGYLEYRGQKYLLKPGEGFFIDCRERHKYGTSSVKWNSTIFHLNGPMVETLFNCYAADSRVKFSAETCPYFEMLQYQILTTSIKTIPYREYKISCLIDILLTEMLTTKADGFRLGVEYEIIPKVLCYIEEHYAEDITLNLLTCSFGISRANLCREFKKYTGFTVKNYLQTLRINNAKFLLRHSACRIAEISEKVGFHDTTHFIQIFKKHTGVTPCQYRKL